MLGCRWLFGAAILSLFAARAERSATAAIPATVDEGVVNSAAATSSLAAPLVRRALTAEAVGDAQRRDDYLREALEADPEYPPARWHSGYVRNGDEWLTVDAASKKSARAGKVAQYRALREQGENTAKDHLRMAQWCATAGLKDQERLHLFAAMQLKPSRNDAHEIIRKLGLVRYQKALLPREQAAWLKEEAKRTEAAMQEWKPRLTAIRRDLESADLVRQSDAQTALIAIKDPAAIPVLESVFSKSPSGVQLVVVRALAEMSDRAANDALMRCAIYAKELSVREAAAGALKPRSLYSYVPTMMTVMQTPVEVEFDTFFANGQFRHRLALFQEGPTSGSALLSQGGASVDYNVTYHPKSGKAPDESARLRPDATLIADATRASNELAANVVREEVNGRAAQALRIATGKQLDADPRQWWSWWLDFNEMYQPEQKPVTQYYYTAIPAPSTYRVSYVSCFVAGTPVWTSTGAMEIEKIKAGDCVLSQDPETGELAFKPVVVTTVRPPSALIEINVDGETIHATRGHPFWVNGTGWQMAKELQAGQILHAATGPRKIESVAEKGEAECYNMIVADFNTYFVGNSRLLVHDNNLRQVTTATVPGLIEPSPDSGR